MTARDNLYQALDLHAGAATEEIESAYKREQERLSGPDHGLDEEERGRRLARVNLAHWILSNPDRRAEYDESQHPADPLVKITANARKEPWTAQKLLFAIVGGFIAIGLSAQILLTGYAGYRVRSALEEPARSRTPAEIAALEQQQKEFRLAAEARREEQQREEARRNEEKELEENRRYAAQVSADLERSERYARIEAEGGPTVAEQEARDAESNTRSRRYFSKRAHRYYSN